MRSAVFVMTDVVGSTALWETYGDDMRLALEVHDRLVHDAVASARGRVFKHTGDGMIAAFDDADDAVDGALIAIDALSREKWGSTGELKIRASVHAGAASERDGDFFGPPVNKVARINGIGHPSQVLVSDVARQLMGQPAGLDLGEHQLRDLSEPVRLWQFDEGSHPPLRTLKKARHNLPVMPTEFIGRHAEVDELRSLLDHHRLVTITGVGGCGKTRLAVEVGAAMADRFPGGVWFADLTAERDGDRVGDRAVAALGLSRSSGPELANAVGVLDEATTGSPTLLIIDNCEHLIDDAAEFAEQLLAQALSVTVLATSREALSVGGERVWRIPNLHDAAVELFVDRAESAGVLGLNDHLDQVEEICHGLDDIPLAIELAAARVSSLSIGELADRLDDRFALLGGGRGRRRQRQQTLQTMMDWSYGLLTDDEKLVLNQLSVFAGSFPLSGAEAVIETVHTPVLDALGSLVRQSLVVPSVDSGRYRLLETVRLYATDRLMSAGDLAAARDRHLAWSLTIAGFDQGDLASGRQLNEGDMLAEIENTVAAMEWADETQDADPLLILFRANQICWFSTPNLGLVGASWRDRIPRPPDSDSANLAGWLTASGLIDYCLGDLEVAFDQLLAAATIVDSLIASVDKHYWYDSLVSLYFRGRYLTATGDIAAALRESDRLAAPDYGDTSGYLRWFSTHLKAEALRGQATVDSMAAAVAAVEASRLASPMAYAISQALLSLQLYRVGRFEEATSASLSCFEAPIMLESIRVIQVAAAAAPLTALGRYGEAVDIIETDFGPMGEALQMRLRTYQLLGLATMFGGLGQIERRDQLAVISHSLASADVETSSFINEQLADVLGSEEAVDALPAPDPTDLAPHRLQELVNESIAEIRALIANQS